MNSTEVAYQRAFIRCTVVACHTVERPDGVCTPRSVRNLAIACADASSEKPQTSVNNASYLLTLHLFLSLKYI